MADSGLPARLDAAARLPERYENARKAIAECERVDECKEWADKAAAMAAYARMAKDDSLKVMAMRIQARALRRAGLLMRQIAPAHGANQNIQDGTVPKVTRESAATDAGLSERQRKTALRIANVPADEFERSLDSDAPPTVTELAERGMEPRFNEASEPGGAQFTADRALAREAVAALSRFSDFCAEHQAEAVARALGSDEGAVRRQVAIVDNWLDRLVSSL
jgi:hypothetical protein